MRTLTYAELIEQLHYDPDTGIFIRLKSNTNKVKVGDVAGCITNSGYVQIKVNGKSYQAQQLAFLYVMKRMPLNLIIQVNSIRHDNRFLNLRESTVAQKGQRRKLCQVNSKSGVLGVTWDDRRNSWKSSLRHQGKTIHVGRFNSKELAYQAYLNKKRELHEFCEI